MSNAWNRSDDSDGYILHSMNYASKGIIDAAGYGAFKRRSVEEARQLIEDLAKCNYKAPSEASRSSNRLKGSGVIELNRMTAIEAKLDALMNKMGNNERRVHTALEVGTVDEGERRKSAEEGSKHEGPYQVKEKKFAVFEKKYVACEISQLFRIFAGVLAASQISVLLDSFYHNFFIRTLFWVIFVSLESLGSVESKYF